MLQPWRWKIRQAQQALKMGRLDEARRLLAEENLVEFLPGKRLAADVARGYADRGRELVTAGDTSAGWRDLETAQELGAEAEAVASLKRNLLQRAIAQAEAYLAAGEPRLAVRALDRLAGRGGTTHETRALRQAALHVETAQRLMRRGDFTLAEQQLDSALVLRPNVAVFRTLRDECTLNARQHRETTQRLHRALASEDWTEVLDAAEQILRAAPECEPARDARRRAWAAVGASLKPTQLPSAEPAVGPVWRNPIRERTSMAAGKRFLLWIDEVGGFLVCLGDRIRLGQPVPGNPVEVPIMGDLSRHHATIRRDGEGYLLEPVRETHIDGRRTKTVTPLADGNVIQLGDSVELRFCRPHALSGTARLEPVSRHRTEPAADGVVLMAETCVLGPKRGSHVVCPNWPEDVILFVREGELMMRTSGPFEVDGDSCEGEAMLRPGSHARGEDFSFSVESLE